MKYDLHIHSGLSPCAEDEMSPNNIVQMAKLHHLDLISVCDHNSTLQQEVLSKVAQKHGIEYWFGIEINTIEEVHVCAYFKKFDHIQRFQSTLNHYFRKIENKKDIFGNQFVYDENDNRIDEYPYLLLNSLDLSLENCIRFIHQNHGKAVLAHIYGRENGIIQQLGFIPENIYIDGVEVTTAEEIKRFETEYPQYQNLPILINSDAHRLCDIIKDTHELPQSVKWFRK